MRHFDVARAFIEVLGEEGVVQDSSSLKAAATATFATDAWVPLIVRPADRDQVQACVRLANRLNIPLYPVSTGKNWGYGSRVPVSDGCILMELGRMNRILDYDEDSAYVTVEPGVTQQQLFDFLAERGSRLLMDSTGASPSCSVVANTVERGFGHTPYGDHFTNVCNFEVVLPTGDCIETGYGRYECAAATPTYRWGVGPILDGLFSQSSFGIVTRLTIWLMPRPEYFQAFFFQCSGPGALAGVLEALRPLRLRGTLKSASHIGNDYKVISGIRQMPWERLKDGQGALSPEALREIADEMKFGEWNGSGALYGTRAEVADARRQIRRALRGKVSKLVFLDDRLLRWAGKFATLCKLLAGWDLSRTLELLKPVYGLMKGRPTDFPLRSVYWRKRFPVPAEMDPDRDGCGLIWSAPVAPISGIHGERMSEIAKSVLLAHGFEPMLSITLLTERTMACVISISYDRDIPGEDQRARQCHAELVSALTAEGYQFYRLGIGMMDAMNTTGDYGAFVRRIKDAIDPNGILAPGRYAARTKNAPLSRTV